MSSLKLIAVEEIQNHLNKYNITKMKKSVLLLMLLFLQEQVNTWLQERRNKRPYRQHKFVAVQFTGKNSVFVTERRVYSFERKLGLVLSFFGNATGVTDVRDKIVKKGSCSRVKLQKSGPTLDKSFKIHGLFWIFLRHIPVYLT